MPPASDTAARRADRSRTHGPRGRLARAAVLVAAALLAAGLTACGDDDDAGETPLEDTVTAAETARFASAVVDIPTAVRGNAFGVTEVHAPPGRITIRMINGQSTQHNIAMDEPPLAGSAAGQGEVSSITAEFAPGECRYHCSLGDHEDEMSGVLIVE